MLEMKQNDWLVKLERQLGKKKISTHLRATPANASLLKHGDEEEASGNFSHTFVIGML